LIHREPRVIGGGAENVCFAALAFKRQ
jgi:hypothetical protein